MQIFYTVQTGDTLYKVATRWNIPLRSLIEANNIKAPHTIFPGQQLSMPPAVNTYVVRPGDTLYAIAMRFGIPVVVIINANGIEPPYLIMPGQVLYVPSGVPYYVVRSGDTLYNIAMRYNVTINGQPRPELIIKANPGVTSNIIPGMTLVIPYPPAGGAGQLAVILSDGVSSYIGINELSTAILRSYTVDAADRSSKAFWSPDRHKLAYVSAMGVISILNKVTSRIAKIDQIPLPAFVNWSSKSRELIYTDGSIIKIYNITNYTVRTINRAGAAYVQFFPGDMELLFEAKDSAGNSQIYSMNIDGSNEQQITKGTEGPYNEVRLSPNGEYILYTSPGASISEIYTIELSTGKTYKIPGGPEAKNYYPSWSSDSSKIAYSATQHISGKYYSLIRVSGAKGEGDHTLAIASCFATPVAWSVDGTKLSYLSGCRDDMPPVEVWAVDLERQLPINLLSGYLFYSID